MTAWNNDIEFAMHLADVADAITMRDFGGPMKWSKKNDGSPVTSTDVAVEEAITSELATSMPRDVLVGEETEALERRNVAGTAASAGRKWVIDPIDQTRHYIRGNPDFATLITLTVDDVATIGVVSAPALGHRWWATRGSGAWKDGKQIAVSRTSRLEEAYLSVAGHREWVSQWDWRLFSQLLDRCAYPTGSSGGFLQQMLVAEGGIDLFIEPWGKIWDHLGGALIVEEAGGCATTLSGTYPNGGSLLATNGILHAEALRYLNPVNS
jgi:histidinol-phosphatase